MPARSAGFPSGKMRPLRRTLFLDLSEGRDQNGAWDHRGFSTGRYINIAYIEADMEKKEIYIEVPEACSETKSQVGLFKKAIYALVHSG